MFQFRRFPTYTYLIQCTLTEYCSAGFPHSEILGSKLMCSSPRLIAACHVLHRLLMPRHSPCALISLTSSTRTSYRSFPCKHENSLPPSRLLSKLNPLRWASIWCRSSLLWFSIRIMQASVWLHCSFVTLLNFLKSPQKFVLCYLSVACSQFLACFTVQFSRCRFSALFRDQIEIFFAEYFNLNSKFSGGPKWTRTTDLTIISRAL